MDESHCLEQVGTVRAKEAPEKTVLNITTIQRGKEEVFPRGGPEEDALVGGLENARAIVEGNLEN